MDMREKSGGFPRDNVGPVRERFPQANDFNRIDCSPYSAHGSVYHPESKNEPISLVGSPSMYHATTMVGKTRPQGSLVCFAYPDALDSNQEFALISEPAVAYGPKTEHFIFGSAKLNSKQLSKPIVRVGGILPCLDIEKEILCSVVYSLLPKIFHVFLKNHIQLVGGAANSLELIMGSSPLGLSFQAKIAERIHRHNLQKKAYSIVRRTLDDSQVLLPWSSDLYPDKLRAAPESPLVLFVKGNISLFSKSSLAVVGTRSPSRFGCFWSNYFSEVLSRQNVCVISGLAHGIDAHAHTGAILEQGSTIGVLGHGLDTIYPSLHKGLANSILDSGGALVSGFLPGIKPEMFHFPERNKVIAGLSDATLVIEANEKGGALITAKVANSMGRPVYALGNRNLSGRSAGCESLIKDGCAIRISKPTDLFNALRKQDIISIGFEESDTKAPNIREGYSNEKHPEVEQDDPILNLLTKGYQKLETLAQMLPEGFPLADAILNLELLGLVRRQGAGLVRA